MVVSSRVLRKIFGLNKEEVRAEWRRLHYDEVYDLHFSMKYYLGDRIKSDGMNGACGAYRRGAGSGSRCYGP